MPVHLATAASGFVIGAGEIFGGGVAPALGGHFAMRYRIQYVPWLAIVALIVGLGITLSIRENAPRRTREEVPRTAAGIERRSR